MAVTVASFVARFPELKDAGAPLITQMLARALTYCPTCPWGLHQDEGVMLYAARFLALSPYGRKANLANKAGVTNYDADLRRMRYVVTSGFRVT